MLDISDPFLSLYNHLKYSARTNHPDKEFSLTYNEFVFFTQIGCCHYCGGSNIVWNLDRKDNTQGYSFDNVVVCCKECNMMKRDWLSYEEFKAIRLFLRRWREATQNEREELTYDLVAWDMKVDVVG